MPIIAHSGYFGEPWPCDVCDDPKTHRFPTPIGKPCLWCDVDVVDADRGLFLPVGPLYHPIHRECVLFIAIVKHQAAGDDDRDFPASPAAKRAQALAVWEYVHAI